MPSPRLGEYDRLEIGLSGPREVISGLPRRPFSVVVGSGPAAIACAQALIEQNVVVVIVDAGRRLEIDRAASVESLRRRPQDEWAPEDLESFRAPVRSGVFQKLTFGSDYAYGDLPGGLNQLQRSGTKAQFSFAQGGLTSVWGAAVLPYRDADLTGWPVRRIDLQPHYRSALGMMPVTSMDGHLQEHFPLRGERHTAPIALASPAATLLERYARHKATFDRQGVWMDRAQLAVDADACTRCRLCIYGCPYGLIYSTADSLRRMKAQRQVHYRPGWRVHSVSETVTTARVRVHSLAGDEQAEIECDRVYLGAGAISSSRIVLESMAAFNRPLQLLDSQMFLAPMFFLTASSRAVDEPVVTLTQLFVELIDREERERTVHFQLYAFSDVVKRAFEKLIPRAMLDSPSFQQQFFGRLMIAQGFLDSSLSGRVELELCRDGNGGSILRATGRPNSASRTHAHRALRKLLRACLRLGALTLPFAAQFGEPGQSFHSGGTFPMRDRPGPFESDLLGRPTGFRRLHLVDASVFPTIPSTTIALSIMANAHRIGTHAPGTAPA